MKFTAAREALLKPLQAVIGVVERRQTMPILSNILMIAREGELSVTATDLEVELVAHADVDTESGGEITVSGRKLLDICRAFGVSLPPMGLGGQLEQSLLLVDDLPSLCLTQQTLHFIFDY